MSLSRFTLRCSLALVIGAATASAALSQTLPASAAQLLGAAGAGGLSLGGGLSALPAAGLNLGTNTGPTVEKWPDLGAEDQQAVGADASKQPPRKPRTPTQFQRFVQESTGQFLPYFGADLFDRAAPFSAQASSAAPAPADYILGPGDQVRVRLWGAVDTHSTQTIDRNGAISLPKIGTIPLAGVQAKDLEETLRKHVSKVYTNVTVDADLGKLRGITVYVVGQAQQPGTYNLNGLSTLVNAVFASGGPTLSGSMRAISLKRGGKTVGTLDLYDFIATGDKSKDFALQPGDVIMIPPAGPRMAVAGAYDHAAIYELKPGAGATNSVQEVLGFGGGLPKLANHHKALLERINPNNTAAAREVRNLTLNAQGLAQPLQDGDILTLLPASPAFSNAVTLQGSVAQPLRHAWFAGMRVQDLIPDREALISPDYYKRRNQLVQNRTAALKALGFSPEQIKAIDRAQQMPDDLALSTEIIRRNPNAFMADASRPADGKAPATQAGNGQGGNPSRDPAALQGDMGEYIKPIQPQSAADRIRGLVEQINWDYAVIERLNKNELRTELIPFNLGKAVVQKDPAHNLPLQPGDVVTILSSADLRLPIERQTRLVRIEGEVVAPGVYQALPGETLPQLVRRIGGLTSQAYLYGAEFTRESVRKQQQQNLDQLVRRLESQLQSASATLTANLTGERALQATALQQQQQQQMKSQIDRLKSLRSKGRVALELDPGKTAKVAPAASGGRALIDSDNASSSGPSSGAGQLLQYLPNLPLEDGDAFMVPSQPAFVAAAGSVNNDNVFVYRPGKTVADIIRAAGLTEDAEPSEAFVLRADGSILSRHGLGWFSSFENTRVMPGDTLVVPPKVDRENKYNFAVRALRDWTQIFSNLGIGAAAIRTLRN